MPETMRDVSTMTNEQLVAELMTFAAYSGYPPSCDPFWYDDRPKGWGERSRELREEVLRRLNLLTVK